MDSIAKWKRQSEESMNLQKEQQKSLSLNNRKQIEKNLMESQGQVGL